ncbi:VWA domain-containing protein [Rhodopseudomonas palustris]|uniref:vWA domain-containing protein n=1 Tax=Rhodopseudomonas palustris TaxID=1076 RepID=UPI000B32AFC0
MRRLPLFILVDASGSMAGEAIQATNVALETLYSALRSDPQALESVHISVISFANQCSVIAPLSELGETAVPTLEICPSGPSHLGTALRFLCKQIGTEVRRGSGQSRGDWLPIVFIMSDGRISDCLNANRWIARLRSLGCQKIIGCAAGPYSAPDRLSTVCDEVIILDTADASRFAAYLRWVSRATSSSLDTELNLPPPPPERQIAL